MLLCKLHAAKVPMIVSSDIRCLPDPISSFSVSSSYPLLIAESYDGGAAGLGCAKHNVGVHSASERPSHLEVDELSGADARAENFGLCPVFSIEHVAEIFLLD